MVEAIAEGLVVACPAALSCATVLVAAAPCASRRRREQLNRRCTSSAGRCRRSRSRRARAGSGRARPSRPGARRARRRSTAQLNGDREAGGDRSWSTLAPSPPTRSPLARRRRRSPAARSSSPGTRPGVAAALRRGGDRRALDNLVANALEHGRGPIRVEGSARAGRLRLSVADGADAGLAVEPGRPRRRAPPSGRIRARSRSADRRRGRRRPRRPVRGLRARARRQRGPRAAAGRAVA